MNIKRLPDGHRIGESHPNAKLTEEIVQRIRRMALKPPEGPGYGYKKISRLTGVPLENVRRIVKRRGWAWLALPEAAPQESEAVSV